MNTRYILESQDSHIKVTIFNDYVPTLENQMELWSSIITACRERKCSRVLTKALPNPTRKIDPIRTYHSAVRATQDLSLKIAFYYPGLSLDDTTQFVNTVARNEGTSIEFFSDERAAIEWLLSEYNYS